MRYVANLKTPALSVQTLSSPQPTDQSAAALTAPIHPSPRLPALALSQEGEDHVLGYLAAYSPKGELPKRPSDDDVAQSIDGCPEVTNDPHSSPAPLWALSLTTVALTLPLCTTQVVRSDREKELDERNGGALTSSIHGAVDDDHHPEAARSRRHLIKAEAEQARSPSRAPPPLFLASPFPASSSPSPSPRSLPPPHDRPYGPHSST